MKNLIYKLCVWALKNDFGDHCKGDEPMCFGCRAYEARKFLEEVIDL
jgi:hypothetical protein